MVEVVEDKNAQIERLKAIIDSYKLIYEHDFSFMRFL